MKRFGIVFALCLMLLAGSSLAGPPLNGAYDSTDLGGVVCLGRYTEGWDFGGSALISGATLNAESWDGAALGTQWRYWCSTTLDEAQLLTSTINGKGNGSATYMKIFNGGYIWLSGDGPWANGDPDYPGVIDTYVEFETITYENWVPIAAVTNVQASAHFDDYPDQCMTFYIGNGTRVATTEIGEAIPVNYPALLDPACAATMMDGAAWDFTSITLSITGCEVGTEESSWGEIKSLYSE